MVLTILLVFNPANAAWLELEVDSSANPVYCATEGSIGGVHRLFTCGPAGKVAEYKWNDGGWRRTEHPVGLQAPGSIAVLGNAGDTGRLWVGSKFDKRVFEYIVDGSDVWVSTEVAIEGDSTWNLTAGQLLSGGYVVIERQLGILPHLRDDCGTDRVTKLYGRKAEQFGGMFSLMGNTCSMRPSMLPSNWGPLDAIMGDKIWTRSRGEAWSGHHVNLPEINVVPSRNTPRRVFTDRTVTDFDSSFIATSTGNGSDFNSSAMVSVIAGISFYSGAYRSLVSSFAETPNAELVFAIDEDHLYRIAQTSRGWESRRLRAVSGRAEALISSNLRGDGIERLYIVENSQRTDSSRITELTYFPRKRRVLLEPVQIAKGASREVSPILTDAFSQALVDSGVVDVIEGNQLRAVDAEREMRLSACNDDPCRLKLLGKVKADYIVSLSIDQADLAPHLEIRLTSAEGAVVKSLSVPIRRGGLLTAVREAGLLLLRTWSKTPRL